MDAMEMAISLVHASKNLNLFLCLDQSKLIHAQKTELASGESGLNENCLCHSE